MNDMVVIDIFNKKIVSVAIIDALIRFILIRWCYLRAIETPICRKEMRLIGSTIQHGGRHYCAIYSNGVVMKISVFHNKQKTYQYTTYNCSMINQEKF